LQRIPFLVGRGCVIDHFSRTLNRRMQPRVATASLAIQVSVNETSKSWRIEFIGITQYHCDLSLGYSLQIMDNTDRKEQQIISYLYLRMLIGLCGIVLPVTCLIYGLLNTIQDSISDYYYTGLRDVFVGTLFVLGFFLLAYRGYESIDSKFANAGFFFALGCALFPCNSAHVGIRIVHFGSAFLLFCVFIFFSLKLFTLGVKEAERTREKDTRNKVYIICGWVMILCIVSIGLSRWLMAATQREATNITFWLESVALLAFAISWLTKGRFYSESRIVVRKVKTMLQSKTVDPA
jgi:hypothetical protein